MSPRAGREREVALVVVSRSPELTARRLASLRRLGSYSLRPRGVVAIVDTYFDTRDGQLGMRHVALRARRTSKRIVLTLKSASRAGRTVQNRSELELPLGIRAAETVLRELRRLGVRGDLPAASALVSLARGRTSNGALLVTAQVRSTRRLVRDVMLRDGGRERRVAEFGLDRVVYGLSLRAQFHEVEIEAKDSGTARDIEVISRALLRQFPKELRLWKHSKLAIGKALARIQARGGLERALTASRQLKAAALPLVLRELSSS